DLLEIQSLHFMPPDKETFRALELAYIAGKRGGLQTAVMNSANEEAVDLFLKERIRYHEITEVVEEAMERYRNLGEISLDKVLETDVEVRQYVRRKFREV
ncbi:MAG: 1-deoxy-D-xylulose-5-phosphate reductoisomerase, partial [Clostridia bacterium]|nr:1-deoxy-D-xylulose-5-phosphate reductoisomerase [Clostridia bacterium]